MATEKSQQNWNEIKGKIKARWDLLSEADIKDIETNNDLLAERLAVTYNHSSEEAQGEAERFWRSIQQKHARMGDHEA